MGPVGKEEEVLVHSKGLNTRTNTDIPQRAYRKAWVNKCEKAHCWEMVVSQQCYFCERQPCFSFHKREAKIESTLLRMDTFHYFVVSLPQGGFFISRHRPDNKSQHLNYLWHQHWGWAFFPQHSSTLHKKKRQHEDRRLYGAYCPGPNSGCRCVAQPAVLLTLKTWNVLVNPSLSLDKQVVPKLTPVHVVCVLLSTTSYHKHLFLWNKEELSWTDNC